MTPFLSTTLTIFLLAGGAQGKPVQLSERELQQAMAESVELVKAQRMLSFATEGFARVAHGAAGTFTFDWWVKPELLL